MKKTYSVGDNTKNLIYSACKRMFYEKGIDATSYVDICSLTGINKGLIPYHFKSKYIIAKMILDEAERNSHKLIFQEFEDETKTFKALATQYLFHKLLRENKNYLRFCYEILSTPEFMAENLMDQFNFIHTFIDEMPHIPSEARLRTIATMSNGFDMEIIKGVYTGFIADSVEDVLKLDIGFILQQFAYSESNFLALLEQLFAIDCRLIMGPSFELSIAR